MIVNIVYPGPEEEARKYTKLFSPYSQSLQEHMLKWQQLPEKSVLGLIPLSCASGPRYDLYALNAKTLDPATWVEFGNEFESFMQKYSATNGSSVMIETFPVQGMQALGNDYSAFPHRDYFKNVIEIIGAYEDDSVGQKVNDFVRAWRDRFANTSGYDKLHVYQNYAHDDEPLSALYGYQDWRHERLTKLKNAYDPHGFFDGYHAVPFDISKWT